MITITINNEDKKETSSVKFDYIDVSLEDIYLALEGLLYSLGFSIQTIENYYLSRAEQIKETLAEED